MLITSGSICDGPWTCILRAGGVGFGRWKPRILGQSVDSGPGIARMSKLLSPKVGVSGRQARRSSHATPSRSNWPGPPVGPSGDHARSCSRLGRPGRSAVDLSLLRRCLCRFSGLRRDERLRRRVRRLRLPRHWLRPERLRLRRLRLQRLCQRLRLRRRLWLRWLRLRRPGLGYGHVAGRPDDGQVPELRHERRALQPAERPDGDLLPGRVAASPAGLADDDGELYGQQVLHPEPSRRYRATAR